MVEALSGSVKQRSLALSSCLECCQSFDDWVSKETAFKLPLPGYANAARAVEKCYKRLHIK